MPRSVNHVASKARRKKILKLTRGYFGARSFAEKVPLSRGKRLTVVPNGNPDAQIGRASCRERV